VPVCIAFRTVSDNYTYAELPAAKLGLPVVLIVWFT